MDFYKTRPDRSTTNAIASTANYSAAAAVGAAAVIAFALIVDRREQRAFYKKNPELNPKNK